MAVSVLEVTQNSKWQDDAIEELNSKGVVVLRSLFPKEDIDYLFSRTEAVMSTPSIAGSVGYYAKDCTKRLYDPLLFGKRAINIVTREKVIEVAERYTESEVLLSEIFAKKDLGINDVYFPVHSDFNAGVKVGTHKAKEITEEMMNMPLAVGCMLYLHDTSEGAFCYSEGTHRLRPRLGTTLENYPENVREEIRAKMQRIDGLAGDLVMFDDRGFHGPDQPTCQSRSVFIFDYYSVKAFGRNTKSPPPVLVNDLSDLNKKQLRVLGLGANVLIGYENHHSRRFNFYQHYPFMAKALELGFQVERAKRKLRNLIKGHKRNYLRKDQRESL